jgi:hypothetical protein
MQQRNLDIAGARPTQQKDADGNLVETGLMELLEQRGAKVTFDYAGNIVMVKNPVMRKQNKVGYEVKEVDKNDNAALTIEQLEAAPNSKSKSGGRSLHDTQSVATGAASLTKNYHGQVMQALYSQPHKMMELKPGVQLNEGGKAYGGISYNFSRTN